MDYDNRDYKFVSIMKYLLSLLMLFSFFNVFSQRKIDLNFELLEPQNGAYIEPGVDFKFKMKIKNLSKDDISSQDTLWIYMLLDGDTVYFDPVRSKLHLDHMIYDNKSIKAGDSITFWNIMQLPMDKINKNVQLCLSVMPHNSYTVSDSILNNNGNCAAIIAKPNPANIANVTSLQSIKIFPNPSSNFMTIECNAPIESIGIMDMKGDFINIQVENNNRIDCNNLNNGIYLLQIKTAYGIQTSRFSVLH